jgi:hypothetical protein
VGTLGPRFIDVTERFGAEETAPRGAELTRRLQGFLDQHLATANIAP